MKTMSKVPSTNKVVTLKKDINLQGLTRQQTKNPGNKIPSVKVPTIPKKDVSGTGYSKSIKRTAEKIEKVATPKLK